MSIGNVDLRNCMPFSNKIIFNREPKAVGKLIQDLESGEYFILGLNRITKITEKQADNIIKTHLRD